MQALFIGQTYIDVTFITDHMPTGDEKHVASAYAVSFGGNAVTAAFCCAKLGIVPDLIATVANDWLGRMFQDMSAKYGISIHPRKVNSSSLSFIMPKDGKRAIVRCRDDEHIHPFPMLNLKGCRALQFRFPRTQRSRHPGIQCWTRFSRGRFRLFFSCRTRERGFGNRRSRSLFYVWQSRDYR